MNHTSRIFFMVAAMSLAVLAGCTDSAPSGPAAGLGSVSVKKYVAIGNSLTAGYQSSGLYQSAQNYSFPNLIAKQLIAAGAPLGTFEQPLYSDPGNPDATGKAARYELISLASANPVIGPRGLAPGTAINKDLPRPYDNLGVPGYVIASFLDTNNIAGAGLEPVVLRKSGGFPKSVYKQVAMLAATPATKPDLVTFWLGNNDVLGFATSGGVSPSAPTPAATFAFLYSQALTQLRTLLPDAKIAVATVPDVRSIPFFTTIGPKMAAGIAGAKLQNSAILGLFYQKHGETGIATGLTSLNKATDVMIPLTASPFTGLLGDVTGAYYKARGIAVPAGIITAAPFGFDPRNPWPDALAFDETEQTTAINAVAAFNASIVTVAAAQSAIVVDINAFFTTIKANGISVPGERFTADYVTGGLFSLDGVHPSSKGAAIIANEFIRVMNAKWGMNIADVEVVKIPGIPGPLSKYVTSSVVPSISAPALSNLVSTMGGKF